MSSEDSPIAAILSEGGAPAILISIWVVVPLLAGLAFLTAAYRSRENAKARTLWAAHALPLLAVYLGWFTGWVSELIILVTPLAMLSALHLSRRAGLTPAVAARWRERATAISGVMATLSAAGLVVMTVAPYFWESVEDQAAPFVMAGIGFWACLVAGFCGIFSIGVRRFILMSAAYSMLISWIATAEMIHG